VTWLSPDTFSEYIHGPRWDGFRNSSKDDVQSRPLRTPFSSRGLALDFTSAHSEIFLALMVLILLSFEGSVGVTADFRCSRERCSRAGWEFLHATHSGSKWTLEDNITFALPGHTEENPVLHVESMRKAISETYHLLWRRYSAAELADKKDDDAGMKLNRNHHKGSRAKGGNYGAAGKG